MGNTRYAVESSNVHNMKCKLMYVTKAKYEEDWHSTMHFHHFSELFYVVKGTGSFMVEEETFDVEEDDLVIVNANIVHTETSKDANPLEYIVLGIEGLEFATWQQNEVIPTCSIHNFKEHKHDILYYLKCLLKEVEQQEYDYTVVSQNLLEVLLINIVRRTKVDLALTPSKKMNRESAYVKQYIDVHYAQPITLDVLAQLTYTNKYYLVHAFKKYMGMSPINYLIETRLKEATSLLESTSYSVAEVSSIVGFSSPSYFSQAYKKKMGYAPKDFRKQKE